MILSGGQLVLADTTPSFSNTYYAQSTGLNLTGFFSSYQQIYKQQLWVYVVVRKRARSVARLPLKVYERQDRGRVDASGSAYGRLLANPNPFMSAKRLIDWTESTKDIFGEAIWLKVRGRDGRPAELWPIHPVNVSVRRNDDASLSYVYHLGVPSSPQFVIPQADVVHFLSYNPETTLRGLSPLEPLRATLLNEDAARRATTAFWRNGGRPSVTLSHPGKLSQDAVDRLSAHWAAIHGGVDNFGKAAILQEGMEPKVLSLTAEDSQYIETRKLNREEVAAAYDMPPPAIHILDHATFSNITEQMRSLYRDSMTPIVGELEADFDMQLRPDFGDESLYAEFLMDEVLRGAFEVRADAYQKSIQSGWQTPAEVRELENLPYIEGSDRLFINAAIIPIDEVSSRTSPNEPATADPVNKPLGEPGIQATPAPLTPKQVRDVIGRLSRVTDLADLDMAALTKGLNGSAPIVAAEVAVAVDVADLRARIKQLCEEPAA